MKRKIYDLYKILLAPFYLLRDRWYWSHGLGSPWKYPRCWERSSIFRIPEKYFSLPKRRASIFEKDSHWIKIGYSKCSRCGQALYNGMQRSPDLFQWKETDDIEEEFSMKDYDRFDDWAKLFSGSL